MAGHYVRRWWGDAPRFRDDLTPSCILLLCHLLSVFMMFEQGLRELDDDTWAPAGLPVMLVSGLRVF